MSMPELGNTADSYGCNAVLIKKVDFTQLNVSQVSSYLSLITEDTWNRIRQEAGVNVGVPVDGLPVQFGATYKDFNENRRQYFEQHKSYTSYDLSWVHVASGVPAEAITAWSDCIKEKTKLELAKLLAQSPVILAANVYRNENLRVGVCYMSKSDVVVTRSLISGGTNQDAGTPNEVFAKGFKVELGKAYYIEFNRNSGQTLTLLVVTDEAGSFSLDVPSPSTSFAQKQAAWYAAIHEGIAAVRKLVEVDLVPFDMLIDGERNTPLHRASELGRAWICQYLMELGADPTQGNEYGDTPLSYAQTRHEGQLVTLVLQGQKFKF